MFVRLENTAARQRGMRGGGIAHLAWRWARNCCTVQRCATNCHPTPCPPVTLPRLDLLTLSAIFIAIVSGSEMGYQLVCLAL